jgi:hypothetical protein
MTKFHTHEKLQAKCNLYDAVKATPNSEFWVKLLATLIEVCGVAHSHLLT